MSCTLITASLPFLFSDSPNHFFEPREFELCLFFLVPPLFSMELTDRLLTWQLAATCRLLAHSGRHWVMSHDSQLVERTTRRMTGRQRQIRRRRRRRLEAVLNREKCQMYWRKSLNVDLSSKELNVCGQNTTEGGPVTFLHNFAKLVKCLTTFVPIKKWFYSKTVTV